MAFKTAEALVKKQGTQFESLLNRQKAEQQGLFDQYTGAIAGQDKLQDVFRGAQQEAGVGQLREGINLFNTQAQGIKSLIDRLPENIANRTAGTFTTQSQRDRQMAVEGGQLSTNLSRLTEGMAPLVQAYGLASEDVAGLLNATAQQQTKELDPYKLQINAMSDRFARETTGFTNQKQHELDALMDKLSRERFLADREWQRAQDLAAEERAFSRQRQLAQEQLAGQRSLLSSMNNSSSAKPPAANLDALLGQRDYWTGEANRQEQHANQMKWYNPFSW